MHIYHLPHREQKHTLGTQVAHLSLRGYNRCHPNAQIVRLAVRSQPKPKPRALRPSNLLRARLLLRPELVPS